MGKGGKDFSQVRMERGPGDAEDLARRATRPEPHVRDPRARAAAYLDLWERHLTQAAASGPDPSAGRQPD
jgi:hypothetical protein